MGTQIGVSTRNLPVTIDGSLTRYWGSDLEGLKLSTRVSKVLPVRRGLVLIPEAGLEWAGRRYRQPFFGVSSRQSSRATFDPFTVESGLNEVHAGIRGRMILTKKWGLRTQLGIYRLLGDAKQSPVTEEPTSLSLVAGLSYRLR